MINKDNIKMVLILITFIIVGIIVVTFLDGDEGIEDSIDIEINYDEVKEDFTEVEEDKEDDGED